MSAVSAPTPHHGELHHPPRKIPLVFRPFVAFWAGLINGVARVLPESNKSFAPYVSVFLMLMVFTALTVGVAQADIHLGKMFPALSPLFDDQISWVDLLVGMIIATMKASFVLAFFMHLNHEASLIYRVMILTVFFFVAMLGLCWLAFDDKPPHKPSMTWKDPFTMKMSKETRDYLEGHHGGGHGAHGDSHGDAHGDGHGDAHGAHGKADAHHGDPHSGPVGDAAGPGHEGQAHKPNAAAADGSKPAEGEAASVPGKHDREAKIPDVHQNIGLEPDNKTENPAAAGSP